MSSLNSVHLIGRLTRDPESRQINSSNGQFSVANFGLAINEKQRSGEDKTTFVDVEVTGNTATAIAQYCRKGKLVFVDGKLQMNQWQDKQTGQNRSKLTIKATRVQFLWSLGDPGQPQQQGWNQAPPQQTYYQAQPPVQQNWQQAPPQQFAAQPPVPPQQSAIQPPQGQPVNPNQPPCEMGEPPF